MAQNYEIDQWKKDLFNTNVHLTLSQRDSVLENTVRREPQNARLAFHNILDPTEGQELTVRHGNTPRIDMKHRRRGLYTRDFHHATLYSEEDRIRMAVSDVTSSYHEAIKRWFSVLKDEIISQAAVGDAHEEEDWDSGITVAKPLPASQIIAVNYVKSGPPVNSGLTLDKMKAAKRILARGQQNPGARLYFAMTNDQLDDLLDIIEVTSGDYNAVKPLVSGEIMRYMGFELKVFDKLPVDKATGVVKNIAYSDDSIIFAPSRDIRADITTRDDLNMETQLYVRASYGAMRLEDAGVVSVLCEPQ